MYTCMQIITLLGIGWDKQYETTQQKTGPLILRGGAISYTLPQIASDRVIY
jgi:hypothetical protein